MSNLSITPAKLEIQLKPNSGYVQSYVVKNNGDQSIILNTSIDSWIPQGNDGNVTYLNSLPNINYSLSNANLKLGQSFILNPQQSQQLVLKIQSITPGDYYLTFFVNQEEMPNSSTNSTQLIKLGSHLLISVSDTETPVTKFTLSNFKVKNPFIDTFFSPITFSGQINNQSDYYNKIDDSITISKNNTIINKLTIFPDNVLAHHSRTMRCLNDINPIECQLQKPLWPGFYKATALNQSTTFLVLPYSLFIFFIFIAIIAKILYSYFSDK